MPTCLSCIMFSGDSEHEYGWCYSESNSTHIDHTCDFWRESLRETKLKGPDAALIRNVQQMDTGEEG